MTAFVTSLGSALAPRIDLTRRAGKSFPIHTMTHGFALHANGRVEIRQGGPRMVLSHVRAGEHDMRGRIEAVRLEAKNDRLLVGCSCPARSFGMMTCKHAWAVLLEADAKGYLSELRTTLKPCAVEPTDAPTAPEPEPDPRANANPKPPPPKRSKRAPEKAGSTGTAKGAGISSSSSSSSSSSASSEPASSPNTSEARAASSMTTGRRAQQAEAIVEQLLSSPKVEAPADATKISKDARPKKRAVMKAKPREKVKALAKTRAAKPTAKKAPSKRR